MPPFSVVRLIELTGLHVNMAMNLSIYLEAPSLCAFLTSFATWISSGAASTSPCRVASNRCAICNLRFIQASTAHAGLEVQTRSISDGRLGYRLVPSERHVTAVPPGDAFVRENGIVASTFAVMAEQKRNVQESCDRGLPADTGDKEADRHGFVATITNTPTARRFHSY